MDHEINAGDIVDGATQSTEQVEVDPSFDRTLEEHFSDLATSISMIGLTYLAVGKVEGAEAVTNVLDFLSWYATKAGLTSPALDALKESVNERREDGKSPIERMVG